MATIAGFIDAIAGGGGLLTIPALLAAGVPPAMALGTNKLQACGGSFSASLYLCAKRQLMSNRFPIDLIDFYWCCLRYNLRANH
ncbi:permease [Actinobacillus equuli]|nr:permease [Actinobacillus equuli]